VPTVPGGVFNFAIDWGNLRWSCVPCVYILSQHTPKVKKNFHFFVRQNTQSMGVGFGILHKCPIPNSGPWKQIRPK
jgi:hypothetical protein